MTLREWAQTQALILAYWPHSRELTEEQLRVQHQLVADLPADQVHAAIHAHARAGEEFPPLPGRLAGVCAQQAAGGTAPSWAATYELLTRAIRRYGRAGEADALQWLAQQSLHAAHFAVEHGWRRLCLEEVDDPAHGGAVRKRLEDAYRALGERVDRDIASGLPVPQVQRRLEQLAATGRALGPGGPRRVDAGDLLGLEAPR